MVGAAGFEPATVGLEIRCSIRLSYAPNSSFHLAVSARPQYRTEARQWYLGGNLPEEEVADSRRKVFCRVLLLDFVGAASVRAILKRTGAARSVAPPLFLAILQTIENMAVAVLAIRKLQKTRIVDRAFLSQELPFFCMFSS